jgi:uncharacterized protein (TIGR02284 family)
MNILDLLKKDHDVVNDLFDKLDDCEKNEDNEDKANQQILFENIKKELLIHTCLEEEIFYPLLEEHEETKDLVVEAYAEHEMVDDLLAEIQTLDVGQEEWWSKIQELKMSVQHHVNDEEQKIFPQVKEVFSEEQIEEMGRLAQKFKVTANHEMLSNNIMKVGQMADGEKSYITTVDALIPYLYDSMNGFDECAKNTTEKKFKKIFETLSEQRRAIIDVLRKEVQSLGGSPAEIGHMSAAMHRLYINLKGLLLTQDLDAIIEEIVRGEQVLLDQYQDALRDIGMPLQLQKMLQEQIEDIEAGLSKIESYMDSPVLFQDSPKASRKESKSESGSNSESKSKLEASEIGEVSETKPRKEGKVEQDTEVTA